MGTKRSFMRIKLRLGKPDTAIILAQYYNHYIQGLVYQHLETHLATLLHDEGIGEGSKRFRYFTFSRLMGDFRREEDRLVYPRGATLFIASPNTQFMESFLLNLLTDGQLRIGDAEVSLMKAEVIPTPSYQKEVLLKALSPITLRDTLRLAPGKRYTHYLAPIAPDFSPRIIENLRHKVRFWCGRDVDPKDAYCLPEKVDSEKNFHMVRFKDTWVKGWSGLYRFSAPPEYYQMALEAGLGERNSAGFGCVEVYRPLDNPRKHRV